MWEEEEEQKKPQEQQEPQEEWEKGARHKTRDSVTRTRKWKRRRSTPWRESKRL
jgi:hypothetical protein